MSDSRPTWQLVMQVAEQMSQFGAAPFRRSELVRGVQAIDPDRRENSIHPIIQGMTEGLSGGPPAKCGHVLRRVARGQFVLIPPTERSTELSGQRLTVEGVTAPVVQKPVEERLRGLREYFDTYVQWYDATVPFVRAGQYELHRATIDRRYRLGSVAAAVHDDEFVGMLHRTLQAWGIGRRASRLAPLPQFSEALPAACSDLERLEHATVESGVDEDVVARIWRLVDGIGVVDNKSKIVAGTKTLHHLLPELVVPMDRQWTGLFFRWSPQAVQTDQQRTFSRAFVALAGVAHAVRPSRLVGAGWRTSPSKIMDNAVIGYCKAHDLA